MKRLCTLALLLGLTACSTPYQEMGFTGGVSATQIDGNTYRITAMGNGATALDDIQNYAMMKAAETTLAAGADYFVILASADRSSELTISTPGTATSTTNFIGGTAFTSTNYNPGADIPVFKPGQSLTIKVFKGTKPDTTSAFDAHEVARFLGPKVMPK